MRKEFDLNIISPYKSSDSKKIQLAKMFDHISGSYDFLNSMLSLGIDAYWRKKALTELPFSKDQKFELLDVAAGTCALSLQAAKMFPNCRINATDISEKMLEIGKKRIRKLNLESRISTAFADAERLEYKDNLFDAVIVAYGVRNFENLEAGLLEMKRVLKNNGKIVILEFSRPRIFPVKQLFTFYFKYILPFIGNLLSKDKSAYSYLFESVQHFPDYDRFNAILTQLGLVKCSYKPLTFGICTVYTGSK